MWQTDRRRPHRDKHAHRCARQPASEQDLWSLWSPLGTTALEEGKVEEEEAHWSHVRASAWGGPTQPLTFISSQITWVWLSLGTAQRGAHKSSTTALTCIVGVSPAFGEGHVHPASRDKCSHTWCQTWQGTEQKHSAVCRAPRTGSGVVQAQRLVAFVQKTRTLCSP